MNRFHSYRQFLFIIVTLFLFSACAYIVTPTGGKKDETPPKIVKSVPPEFSTNYTGNKITVTFDEYFTLNDVANQIFMSPVTTDKPKVTYRKKNLLITLPDSLSDNTTYSISFGNSIADLNEGNKLTDFKFIFSTGSQIDSLVVKGKVEDAFNKKSEKGILVLLFDDLSDSAVSKSKPVYYTRTNDKGYFRIDHIKEGKYKLFCLNDQNFNYQYDLPNESIAFADSIITVKDTTGKYTLELFRALTDKQLLLKALSKEYGKATFVFAKPTENLSVTLLKDTAKILTTEFSSSKDSVNCWLNDLNSDSLYFILHDRNYIDTVGVSMKPLPKDSALSKKSKLTFRSNLTGMKRNISIAADKPLILDFIRPVQQIDRNKEVLLTEDSTKKILPVTVTLKTDSVTNRRQIVMSFDSKENTAYHLKIPDSLVYDIYGTTNDNASLAFHTTDVTDLGNLTVTIFQNDSSDFYYAQLVSKAGNTIDTKPIQPGKNILKYESLNPGSYFVRAVRDGNKNGKWDTGNYWKNIQPEKVVLFPQEIIIRANWDVEQNFVIPR